ncbi:MAG: hypothetical protein OXI61_18040 [Candidatus Poribacteria bacterium]|nr:hypothetical protein [Candidatus Poribacteria bacterium]
MRIKEGLKESGEFWLPSTPDKKVHGTLSISDGGNIELEVTGFFEDWRKAHNVNLNRIVGHIQKGRSIPLIFVTLDDCAYKTLPIPVGIPKALIRVSRAFIGVQYDEGESPHFNTLTFSLEGIGEWVDISGIRVENQPEKWTTTISYEPREDVSLNLDNGMQLLITWGHSLKYLINKEAGIREKIYFKLISPEARELNEFTSLVRKITEFLCFAMNETVCLDSMHAISDDLTQEIADSKTEPVPINIYSPSWPYSKDVPQINLYNMLFKFKEIQNNAERIINNWIKSYEQYDSAFRLYFLAKMGEQTYLEEKFLTLVQGLEAYHQRIAERMVLRNRITNIVEPFKDIIGTNGNPQELIDSIMDTRNGLTHHNPAKEPKVAKGVNLWYLCLKMELLFELHILQLMGFSREKIDSIVDNSPELKRKCNW